MTQEQKLHDSKNNKRRMKQQWRQKTIKDKQSVNNREQQKQKTNTMGNRTSYKDDYKGTISDQTIMRAHGKTQVTRKDKNSSSKQHPQEQQTKRQRPITTAPKTFYDNQPKCLIRFPLLIIKKDYKVSLPIGSWFNSTRSELEEQ